MTALMWVLVVEDEPAMARMLRQGLEERSHTVSVAIDGLEALELALARSFDAIISDVMLPALNGYPVTRRLHSSGSHAPIIMLTARDSTTDIMEGLEAGAASGKNRPLSSGFRLFA